MSAYIDFTMNYDAKKIYSFVSARATALGGTPFKQGDSWYIRRQSGAALYSLCEDTEVFVHYRHDPWDPMAIYEDEFSLVVTNKDFVGELVRFGMDGEIQLAVYKAGHKEEACEQMTEPGKLRKELRCPDLSILFTLFALARVKWQGKPCHFEAVDDHRINGYKRLLKRAGLGVMQIPGDSGMDYYLIMPTPQE